MMVDMGHDVIQREPEAAHYHDREYADAESDVGYLREVYTADIILKPTR